MAQKLSSNYTSGAASDAAASSQTATGTINSGDVNTAQSASQMLLMMTKSYPQNIGMGALIMATSLAAREMNIPLENIVAMFDRTITGVYAASDRTRFSGTVN